MSVCGRPEESDEGETQEFPNAIAKSLALIFNRRASLTNSGVFNAYL
jgi:hypothetical protein